jgi:hypothetical protein
MAHVQASAKPQRVPQAPFRRAERALGKADEENHGTILIRDWSLEHDPEKWVPVFRKDHAQIKEIERDDDSKKSHHALAPS